MAPGVSTHARWVRISHGVLSLSVLTLAFSGFMILLVHPRLYWGDAGNDLMPALIELRIGPNAHPIAFENRTPFFETAASPITASRKEEPFNQNGWARSLHFLAAWILVVGGMLYLLYGVTERHFRTHLVPGGREIAPRTVWRDVLEHLRFRIAPATGGPSYGVLQKIAYSFVIFIASPLIVLTGFTMSPAITAAAPWLLTVFGGYQSARTIHFFTFGALVLIALAHIAMVVLSGFRRQLRAMTVGE